MKYNPYCEEMEKKNSASERNHSKPFVEMLKREVASEYEEKIEAFPLGGIVEDEVEENLDPIEEVEDEDEEEEDDDENDEDEENENQGSDGDVRTTQTSFDSIDDKSQKELDPFELNNKFDKMVESIKNQENPLNESDLQTLLLTYTEETSKNLENQKDYKMLLKQLEIKVREKCIKIVFLLIDCLNEMETKTYEYFWISVLYLNFWFPKLATFLRYVFDRIKKNDSPYSIRFKFFTNIFTWFLLF
ncbi:uncharacterized protein NDAI_0H03040 [Naumovozyma dairenensis CBS 421]|uniref:Uncharacterized protein n=1 Tax=Naumovozyma dairenensis (strain ATCC 10597 / BCRC 20456 / CBS 421 / NBRC 0211 / NRRL Y-12639) TaxID=1071378 RepID=G0WFB6_NAUDC|nr:hypothetical protein NDAI_0H03040 [Naumovozyma dairenensis CBS 421]CCD26477.1 hypothetical protein NDAI_0H03040 [Naumovozyma dairenensis CBS 421]